VREEITLEIALILGPSDHSGGKSMGTDRAIGSPKKIGENETVKDKTL